MENTCLNGKITRELIDFSYYYKQVVCDEAGAICIFSGSPRQGDYQQRLLYILYEAYQKAAEKELDRIAQEAKKQFPIKKIFIVHRIGKIYPKECSLLVLLATPHRKEGLRALDLIITNIKNTVPVWKKEVFKNHTSWGNNEQTVQNNKYRK